MGIISASTGLGALEGASQAKKANKKTDELIGLFRELLVTNKEQLKESVAQTAEMREQNRLLARQIEHLRWLGGAK